MELAAALSLLYGPMNFLRPSGFCKKEPNDYLFTKPWKLTEIVAEYIIELRGYNMLSKYYCP